MNLWDGHRLGVNPRGAERGCLLNPLHHWEPLCSLLMHVHSPPQSHLHSFPLPNSAPPSPFIQASSTPRTPHLACPLPEPSTPAPCGRCCFCICSSWALCRGWGPLRAHCPPRSLHTVGPRRAFLKQVNDSPALRVAQDSRTRTSATGSSRFQPQSWHAMPAAQNWLSRHGDLSSPLLSGLCVNYRSTTKG